MTPRKPIADVHTCHATCPCQPSKLGPLEFKAEDGRPVLLNAYTSVQCISIDDANRLLAERLEKAPEVFGVYDTAKGAWTSSYDTELDSYRARLVCIEKLEGK